MTEKPIPCICGTRPERYGWARVACYSCHREVLGVNKKNAVQMWNAAMKALRDAKNEA